MNNRKLVKARKTIAKLFNYSWDEVTKMTFFFIECLLVTNIDYSHTDKRIHTLYESNIFNDDLKHVLNMQALISIASNIYQ